MPFAMMMGAINAVMGLIGGVIVAIFATAIMSIMSEVPNGFNSNGFNSTGFGVLFGLGSIIAFPILGFIGGLIQGLIFAVIYNLLAPMIGGIKLRFQE